jgi:hypothetical protein
MTENKFWRNQIETFTYPNLSDLQDDLNEFYKNRFVIATQVFAPNQTGSAQWVAIVYFKVKPEF